MPIRSSGRCPSLGRPCRFRPSDSLFTASPRRHGIGPKSARHAIARSQLVTLGAPPTAFLHSQAPAQDDSELLSSSLHGIKKSRLPIREQLRQWAKENDGRKYSLMPPDVFIYGTIGNNVVRTQATGSVDLDHLRTADDDLTASCGIEPMSEYTETPAAVADSRMPGDLVELRQTGSRMPLFGIYLGFFGDRHHYYAANGKWVISIGFSSLFTVSNFVHPSELDPVLAKIPKAVTPDLYDKVRQQDAGPSREDGAQLIRRMNEFASQSESVYQSNLVTLEGARTLLCSSREAKYLSLFEIADALLPSFSKIGNSFPPQALYAVHLALYRSEVGFRPLSPSSDCHRRDHLFEVTPEEVTKAIELVATMVREYTDLSSRRTRRLSMGEIKNTSLGNFILQARKVVSRSRQHRKWTPHGILEPSAGLEMPKANWCPSSKTVIQFLEWWASYDLFDAGSRFHSYGASILRALDLYPDAILDQSTAWTFLQEIAVIAPWEVPSRYKVRFPGVTITRGGGLERPVPQHLEHSKRADIAEGARKGRQGSATFCIDAPSTTVIDDGIALEPAAEAGQFWIHVHVADPASVIKPKSELCTFTELIPENIYLPGHFQAMLPSEVGEDDGKDYKSESLLQQFSLRPGAPALTFSAKLDESGHLLDYKIEPSRLGDVLYLDPQDVAGFCGQPPPPPVEGYSLSVGTPPATTDSPTKPGRLMTAAEDLDNSNKTTLLTLHRLAEAVKQRRIAKGAWPYFFPRPSVSVSFHEGAPTEPSEESTMVIPPDPHIRVTRESFSDCSLVSQAMVLAGEVAARWCADRALPIPFRREAMPAERLDSAVAYAQTEIYPLIHQGIDPPARLRRQLARLTGGVEISSQPGPYFLLGLEMYAKATSPLRRFADLLLHWQIHAALAHERQTGRRLDPSTHPPEAVVPFSAAALQTLLPLLQMREKMARLLSRSALDWILIALVRAWRFDGSAPRSFRFTAESRWRQGLLGRLDFFDLAAVLDVAGLAGCRLLKDVQVGDEFLVELADVNVHSRQILVRAIRPLNPRPSPHGPPNSSSSSSSPPAQGS